MASEDLLGGGLSELVLDSRLDVVFGPGYTVHPRAAATRREKYSYEKWIQQQKPVGKGGMGAVYVEARETSQPGPVVMRAVKKIDLSGNAEQKKMIRRELEALFKFSQPSFKGLFIQPYGWFISEQCVHIAMEFYELGDLQKYIDNPAKCPQHRLPENEVGSIASQILDALYVMHTHNFSHWDLKPANLLIKRQPPNPWLIKLGDFGISKRGEAMTQFTSLAGTLDYMPPEHHGYRVRSGADNSRAVDMWCFGQTIYRLLTGQGMFRNAQERHSFFCGQAPFPDSVLQSLQISREGVDFLRRLTVVDPGARISADVASQDPWVEKYDQELDHGVQDATFVYNQSVGGQFPSMPSHEPTGQHTTPAQWPTGTRTSYPGSPSPFPDRTSHTQPLQPTQASAAWPTDFGTSLGGGGSNTVRQSDAELFFSDVSSQASSGHQHTSSMSSAPSTRTFSPYSPGATVTRKPVPGTQSPGGSETARRPVPGMQSPPPADPRRQSYSAFSPQGDTAIRPGTQTQYQSTQASSAWPETQFGGQTSYRAPTDPTGRGSVPPPSQQSPSWSSDPHRSSHPSYAPERESPNRPSYPSHPAAPQQGGWAGGMHQSYSSGSTPDLRQHAESPGRAPPLNHNNSFPGGQQYQPNPSYHHNSFPADSYRQAPPDAQPRWSANLPIGSSPLRSENVTPSPAGPDPMSRVKPQLDAAKLLVDQENYDQAKDIYRDAIRYLEGALGREHIATIEAKEGLAKALLKQDVDLDAAEEICRLAWNHKKAAYGMDDPATLESMNCFCDALLSNEKEVEAEPYCRDVLQARKRVLGPAHTDTVKSMEYLAIALNATEKYEEAEAIFREVVEMRRRTLGMTDGETLDAMVWLADTLSKKQEDTSAEPLYREALRIMRGVLGNSEKRTLEAVNGLGITLHSMDQNQEAEKLLREALEGRTKKFGYDHYSTQDSINWLALVLEAQDRYDEAEKLWRDLLEIKIKKKGEEDEAAMGFMQDLSSCLDSGDKREEALGLARRCLHLRTKVLGATHEDTLGTMMWLGDLLIRDESTQQGIAILRDCLRMSLDAKGEYDELTMNVSHKLGTSLASDEDTREEGQKVLRQVIEKRTKALGEDHEDTIDSIVELSYALAAESKWDETMELERKIVEIRTRTKGDNDEETISAKYDLAKSLVVTDENEEAEPLLREVLAGRRRILGSEHEDTVAAMTSLAELLVQVDRQSDAEPLFREALRIHERLGSDGVVKSEIQQSIAKILNQQGLYPQAEEFYAAAWNLHRVATSEDDETTLEYMAAYGVNLGIYQEKLDQAEGIFRRLVELYERVLGSNDQTTLATLDDLVHVLYRNDKYDQAIPLARTILERQRGYPLASPGLHSALMRLGFLYNMTDNDVESEKMYAEAYALQKDFVGFESAGTIEAMQKLANVKKHRGDYQGAIQIATKAVQMGRLYHSKDVWEESQKLLDECKGNLGY